MMRAKNYYMEYKLNGEVIKKDMLDATMWSTIVMAASIKYRDGMDWDSVSVYDFNKEGAQQHVIDYALSDLVPVQSQRPAATCGGVS